MALSLITGATRPNVDGAGKTPLGGAGSHQGLIPIWRAFLGEGRWVGLSGSAPAAVAGLGEQGADGVGGLLAAAAVLHPEQGGPDGVLVFQQQAHAVHRRAFGSVALGNANVADGVQGPMV